MRGKLLNSIFEFKMIVCNVFLNLKSSLPPLKQKSKVPITIKTSDCYLININDYKIIRNINRGGFGIINLVQNKKTGEQFAAKTNLIPNKSQNKLFISREVRILSQIQHCTVIQF